MDHVKFYWVAFLNQRLYVYATEKDCKPLFELDITGYKARPVAISNSNNNKPDFKFELVAPGKKTYQFTADKQSDLEMWVKALNVPNNTETSPPKEWIRELPSLPERDQTYDTPDNVKRLLAQEPRYGVPGRRAITNELTQRFKTMSPVGGRRTSTMKASAKEGRELPLLPHQQQTYDKLESTIRPVQPELYESLREEVYHFIDDHQKPVDRAIKQQMYDHPEPRIRPVTKLVDPDEVSDEIYSIIDSTSVNQFTTREAIYNNLGNNVRKEEHESTYYNLVPYPGTNTQCVYDVIHEQPRPAQYFTE